MGMNQMWLKEMLGLSGGYISDRTPFVSYDSCNDLATELKQGLSDEHNYQFLRLLGLVAGLESSFFG